MSLSSALPDSAATSARASLGWVSRWLLAASIVVLLAGLAIFTTSSHLAWDEQDERSQFQPVQCAVLERHLKWWVIQAAEEEEQQQEYRIQKQLLVQYELNGTEVEIGRAHV